MNETMEREIQAQADLLPALLDPLAEICRRIAPPSGRIFAGGCGDCTFAPAALAEVFAGLGLDIAARTAMELAGYTRFRPGDTVILASISGGTRRTVQAAEVARRAGARVVALTCGATSPLAQTADDLLLLPFEPISRKTPHTLDYLVTLEALAVLAFGWGGRQPGELTPALAALPDALVYAQETAESLVAALDPSGRVFLTGGGPDFATAQYGAAKFHEAGGLAAFAAESENFIHGMNFLLEPSDLLVSIATEGISLARGRQVAEMLRDLPLKTSFIRPRMTPGDDPVDRFAALLDVTLALQVFCLRVANRLGLNVDLPRAGRPNAESHLRIQTGLMKVL